MIVAVRLIDAIGQRLGPIIGSPYWQDRLIASYTTRSFSATDAQFQAMKHAVRIDQAPTNALSRGAIVKDVEVGAANPGNVFALAAAGHKFVTYCPRLQSGVSLADCRAAVARARAVGRVKFWVADWGFSETHALNFMAANPDVVAVQWASPTTNGTMGVPGFPGQTLASLNVDLSVARRDYFLGGTPAPKPLKNAQGTWKFQGEWDAASDRWKIHGTKGKHVKMGEHPVLRRALITVDERHGNWDVHRQPEVKA